MLDPREQSNGDYLVPLELLHERFDAAVTGPAKAQGRDLHAVILARLASNRRGAEAAGWTQCVLERDGGMGRLRLFGVAPAASTRSEVPDWTVGAAEPRAARR